MTTDAELAVRRAHRLDQMAKLALLAGLVLLIVVTVFLMQQGFGARGELLLFGLWCCFGLFLLLKTRQCLGVRAFRLRRRVCATACACESLGL